MKNELLEQIKEIAPKLLNLEELWTQRNQHYHTFLSLGFPNNKIEQWRQTPIDEVMNKDFHYVINNSPIQIEKIQKYLTCTIENFEKYLFLIHNGSYIYTDQPIYHDEETGILAGSLRHAYVLFPEIFNKYFDTIADPTYNGFVALNMSLASSGFFLYIPAGVKVNIPIQLINYSDGDDNPFMQSRNIIIIDDDAEVTFLQCDDTYQANDNSFSNILTEFYLGKNAKLYHYKLQNKSNYSSLINTMFFKLKESSFMHSLTLTYNGGFIRNESIIDMDELGAEAKMYGLGLIDRTQIIENLGFIHHNAENCNSYQAFKNIIDEKGRGLFNGHITVMPGAQKTNAYQIARNILLTSEARVFVKPFLEIYADDVKCSHGSSIGKLDDDALFYLMQRGICERNAKLLLMYAFTSDIVDKIHIEDLKKQTIGMINRRLNGELTSCDQCVLGCTKFEIPEIDFDKMN